MKLNANQYDQQIEALADSLSQRLWCGVILPGIGVQLVLFMAFSLALGLGSLSADDDKDADHADDKQPRTVVVASLPDEGHPPAPPTETAVTEQPESAKAEANNKSEPAAEVVTDAQVEQIAEPAADKAPSAAEVRELSVEPVLETRPMLPADAPAWVGAPNDMSERIHRLYVASFTADSPELLERDEMLDEPLVAAVKRYLDESVFPGQGAWDLPVSADFVRKNLLDATTSYVAPMTTQSGTV